MKKNIDNILKHPIISGIVISLSLTFINFLFDKLKNYIPQLKSFLELEVKVSLFIVIISIILVLLFIFNLVYLRLFTNEFNKLKIEKEIELTNLNESHNNSKKEISTLINKISELESELNTKNNELSKIENSKKSPSFKLLSKFQVGDIVGTRIEDKLIGREQLQVIEIDEINIKIKCKNEKGKINSYIPQELYSSIEFERIREKGRNGLHEMLFGN